jgi:hypothetical protein
METETTQTRYEFKVDQRVMKADRMVDHSEKTLPEKDDILIPASMPHSVLVKRHNYLPDGKSSSGGFLAIDLLTRLTSTEAIQLMDNSYWMHASMTEESVMFAVPADDIREFFDNAGFIVGDPNGDNEIEIFLPMQDNPTEPAGDPIFVSDGEHAAVFLLHDVPATDLEAPSVYELYEIHLRIE